MLKINGRPDKISRLMLMVTVGVAALIAFFALFLAVDVFFPGIGVGSRVAVGLVGGLLIGFINWMIVFSRSPVVGNSAG